MKGRARNRSIILLFVLGLTTLACLSSSGGKVSPTNVGSSPVAQATPSSAKKATVGPSTEAAPSPTVESIASATPSSRGPGAFDLAEPAAGVDSLNAYQATFKISFDGTQDGQPSQWSEVYTITVAQQPQARLLTIETSGLPEDQSISGWAVGEIAGVNYIRQGPEAACSAVVASPEKPLTILEPAQILPSVLGAEEAGSGETLNGLAVNHYTFDERALGAEGLAKASGEVWIASDGGFVVKYSLRAEGGTGFFDESTQGVMTWDYELTDANQPQAVEPPQGCPPGLVDAPRLPDATNVSDMPGYLAYDTASDVQGVVAFYQEQMPAAGYQAVIEPSINDGRALLEFSQDDLVLTIYIKTKATTNVQIILERGHPETAIAPELTPEATPTPSQEVNIINSLMLTLGSGDTPSVFPSYHLEVSESIPVDASGQVGTDTYRLQADVQGADMHLTFTKALQGGSPKTTEGYLVGGQEYEVVNGQLQESLGTIQIEWVSWPLDVIMPLSTAALGPTPQAAEMIDGRPANVFALDSANADPQALAALQGMNPFAASVTAARGTAWLDQQTGALLKVVLDYEAEIKDLASGKILGTGTGHIEIVVTQVGAVEVMLP